MSSPSARTSQPSIHRLLMWVLVAGLTFAGVGLGALAVTTGRWINAGYGACVIAVAGLMSQLILSRYESNTVADTQTDSEPASR